LNQPPRVPYTLEDNVELKKEAYKLWKIEERGSAGYGWSIASPTNIHVAIPRF